MSTSDIVERRLQPPGPRPFSHHAEVVRFNAIAARIMRALDIPVIDAYAASRLPHMRELAHDGVHYGKRYEFYYLYVATEILRHVCQDADAAADGP